MPEPALPPTPAPLAAYAARFDGLFARPSQRAAFRQYLTGLLLPAERNKTLTALANAEPVVGAQRPAVQRLQWFLSESTWDAAALTARRLELLRADASIAPHARGALIVDETGDRKDGERTAHVGAQYPGNRGKVENGVVSVATVWADEGVYYPLAVEPYTPERWFARGKADPAFRTKPEIALALVDRARAEGWPFGAVVADCLYGEHRGFVDGLRQRGVPYVLALKPSHAWGAPADEVNWAQGAAAAARWAGPDDPGAWAAVERTFRDGHAETWWALEATAGPYGPDRPQRLVVATPDPARLPARATWYLTTALPAADADVAAVVRLYGLRNWVEQEYKQVKHALGWSQYQVRSDRAIRRHWALVQCAFAFCWAASGAPPGAPEAAAAATVPAADRGEKAGGRPRGGARPPVALLAGGAAAGAGVAGAGDPAVAVVARLVRPAAARPAAGAARLGRPGPPLPRLR